MLRINVARLDFCYEDGCAFSNDLHAVVEIERVELSRSKATAISYAWGEFDRRYVDIGHIAQKTDQPVRMMLGQEWVISEVILSLVTLCIENGETHGSEHAAIWIDQLCIPQNSVEIREALANIPSIYKTLDVVALMPGSRCRCLGQTPGDTNFEGMDIPPCVNALGLCSYFHRQWTRQEMLYSGRIRVVRTSTEEIACTNDPSSDQVLPFGRLRFAQLVKAYSKEPNLARRMSEQNLPMFMRAEQFRFLAAAGEVMGELGMTRADALKFIAGQKLELPGAGQGEKTSLGRFLRNLSVLTGSFRRATKPRDYITSVWVDCPGYVLPLDFKEMNVGVLMDDALGQLERNHGVTLVTTAPGGLFQDVSTRSAAFKPATYFENMEIQCCGDMYGVLYSDCDFLPIDSNGHIPICFTRTSSTPLSYLAKEYSQLFSKHNALEVEAMLAPVIGNWPSDVLASSSLRYALTLQGIAENFGLFDNQTDNIFQYSGGLVQREVARRKTYYVDGYELPLIAPLDLQNIRSTSLLTDHETAVYLTVAQALGLNFQVCLKHRLKLMVVLDNHPCIGLVRQIPDDSQDIITVCAGLPKSGGSLKTSGDLFYEVVKEQTAGEVIYKVFGVWVPFGFSFPYVPGALIGTGAVLG